MSALYVPNLTHPSHDVQHKEVDLVLGGTDPEKLTNERLLFTNASVTGVKGSGGEVNSGDVYLGWSESSQPILVPAGATVSLESDRGTLPNNLEKIWVRGASGDGVVVNYY